MLSELFLYASVVLCYATIGFLIYTTAVDTDIPKREQLKYSVLWPWLFIATIGCALWDYIFPVD